jgi:hypothetical protein
MSDRHGRQICAVTAAVCRLASIYRFVYACMYEGQRRSIGALNSHPFDHNKEQQDSREPEFYPRTLIMAKPGWS